MPNAPRTTVLYFRRYSNPRRGENNFQCNLSYLCEVHAEHPTTATFPNSCCVCPVTGFKIDPSGLAWFGRNTVSLLLASEKTLGWSHRRPAVMVSFLVAWKVSSTKKP